MREDDIKLVLWVRFFETFPCWGVSMSPLSLWFCWGIPAPRVHWYRDNVLIDDSDQVVQETNSLLKTGFKGTVKKILIDSQWYHLKLFNLKIDHFLYIYLHIYYYNIKIQN